jgi:hypothetical protein
VECNRQTSNGYERSINRIKQSLLKSFLIQILLPIKKKKNHCYDAFLIGWLTYEKLGEFVYVCLWWVKVFRGFVNLGLNVVEERVRAQNWLGFDDF